MRRGPQAPLELFHKRAKRARLSHNGIGEQVPEATQNSEQIDRDQSIMGQPGIEHVKKAWKAEKPIALETPLGEEGDLQLGETIEARDAVEPAEAASLVMLKAKVEGLLEAVTPRDCRVLKLRFGLHDGRPRTLSEIGRGFGLTRERICQIEAGALRKLRDVSVDVDDWLLVAG